MGVKKVSQKGKGGFATYKATLQFNKNKKRKLERHLKLHPEDTQAAEAVKNTAKATPRKTPTRMKARLDSWVLANENGEHTHNRSCNKLSGRLSPWGKAIQEAARFSKAVANAIANDPKRVLQLHSAPIQNLAEVWSGWAEYEANSNKPVVQQHKKKKGKPKPKK